jgi:putative N6-adenine-specific DNA methylase
MKYELIATSVFGLEAVVRREIEALGLKVLKTEDGRITYVGDERAVVRSNLWLRSADRVYIRMAEFDAATFEDLYQQVKAVPWEELIPSDGSFPVTGTSVKSALHSVPACQSIVKKAVVDRLSAYYLMDRFPESGAEYRIRFSILKDRVTLMVDTSGDGLHKRGYRVRDVAAPMKETLAAALVSLSFWKEGAMRRGGTDDREPRVLVDTCCGSGTILIEAAMMARNMAPGLNRTFPSMEWDAVPADIWKEERKEAFRAMDLSSPLRIIGMDIDKKAVAAARANADEAGVGDDIDFIQMDMRKFSPDADDGIIITNPPYGERIGDRESIDGIMNKLASIANDFPGWSLFVITTDSAAEEKYFGRKADRRRKLYNGRLQTTYYQFHGRKPGRRP